jgi:hypothetical protein
MRTCRLNFTEPAPGPGGKVLALVDFFAIDKQKVVWILIFTLGFLCCYAGSFPVRILSKLKQKFVGLKGLSHETEMC